MTEFNAFSVLDCRDKSLPSDRWSYKLGESTSYGIDIAFPDQLAIDESKMCCVIPFADGKRRDGVGDLLEVGGIRTERHRNNPIVLFDHGKNVQLPVALAEDRNTKAYTVEIDSVARIASANCFFYQGTGLNVPNMNEDRKYDHAVFCEQLFDLLAKRLIRAGSIGYQVVKAMPLQPDYERGTPAGLHLLVVNLLEVSAVVLPANGDTVRKALSMPKVCGKALSPMLVKSLTPYVVGETKAQIGYENPLSESNVPPAVWKPGAGAKIKEIRMKYRKKAAAASHERAYQRRLAERREAGRREIGERVQLNKQRQEQARQRELHTPTRQQRTYHEREVGASSKTPKTPKPESPRMGIFVSSGPSKPKTPKQPQHKPKTPKQSQPARQPANPTPGAGMPFVREYMARQMKALRLKYRKKADPSLWTPEEHAVLEEMERERAHKKERSRVQAAQSARQARHQQYRADEARRLSPKPPTVAKALRLKYKAAKPTQVRTRGQIETPMTYKQRVGGKVVTREGPHAINISPLHKPGRTQQETRQSTVKSIKDEFEIQNKAMAELGRRLALAWRFL